MHILLKYTGIFKILPTSWIPRKLSYDILKTIQQFVKGYEVEKCSLFLWEKAILEGYKVFNQLKEKQGDFFKIFTPGEASILSANVSEQNQGVILWRYFLIAALIFLLLETFILRWWK